MSISFNKFINSRAATFLSAVCLLLVSIGVATANSGDKVMVEMHTSKGLITLELDAEKAPVTVANFIEYVKSGHFDGMIFHRVIPGFVIRDLRNVKLFFIKFF